MRFRWETRRLLIKNKYLFSSFVFLCGAGAIKDSRIRMINHLSCQLYDAIEYYDFEQFHLEEEEGRIIAEKLKGRF